MITGSAYEIISSSPGKPTWEELILFVGRNRVATNMIWVLVMGFIVMFMQTGFAMLATGLTRAKNVAHTIGMNFAIYAIGITGFWICGFALMFGGLGPLGTLGGPLLLNHEWGITLFGKPFDLLGWKGFFLSGDLYDVGIYAFFLFQMVFMDTAATIPTGAMAERWKFSAFILYGFFVSMFLYPIYGNWVWGGGWLADLGINFGLGHGMVDFAGASVVHLTGGVIALVGAKILGPRLGKYGKDGKVHPIPPHNLPMAIIGTFILALGWLAFNTGSSLSGTDLRIGVIAANTMLASAAGTLAAMFTIWWKAGRPDLSIMANGLLAGCVSITSSCAFVNGPVAFLIGAIGGVIVVSSIIFFEKKAQIDDPVGAISTHGVCGVWSVIALGLFADGTYGEGWNGLEGSVRGLFYGDTRQLMAQLIGILANFIFVGLCAYLFFKIIDKTMGLRVSPEVEHNGLDLPEMGLYGYLREIESTEE
ncbi:MAG: ammonium transporter [Deltaproteobacteria bacterium]|nr:ammonium transporter [Deltaproteobacteria bacterium]